MNTSIKTFNKDDEANNDWEAILPDELVHWCWKHYRTGYQAWKAEQDSHLMFILTAKKAELLNYINDEEINNDSSMPRWTKPKLQFYLIERINNNNSMCNNKDKIINH